MQIDANRLADNLSIAYLAALLHITIASAAKQYKSLGPSGSYWKALAENLHHQNELKAFELREAQGGTVALTDLPLQGPLPLYLRLAWKAALDNVTIQTAQKRYGNDPIGYFWIDLAESALTASAPRDLYTEMDAPHNNSLNQELELLNRMIENLQGDDTVPALAKHVKPNLAPGGKWIRACANSEVLGEQPINDLTRENLISVITTFAPQSLDKEMPLVLRIYNGDTGEFEAVNIQRPDARMDRTLDEHECHTLHDLDGTPIEPPTIA